MIARNGKTQHEASYCAHEPVQMLQYRQADTTQCRKNVAWTLYERCSTKKVYLKINNLYNKLFAIKYRIRTVTGVLKMIKAKKATGRFQWELAILWWLKCKVKQASTIYKISSNQWDQKWGRKSEQRVDVSTRPQHMHKQTEPIRLWFPFLTNIQELFSTSFSHKPPNTHGDETKTAEHTLSFVLVLQKWKQSWSETLAQANTCWQKRERMWVRGQGQRSRRHRPLRNGLMMCSLIKEAD